MIFLKKMVLFAHPVGIVWLLLSVWLARRLWLRQWRSVTLPGLIWLVMTLFTCTPTTGWLMAGLENRLPAVVLADVQPADVIICLGGGAEPSLKEPTGVSFNSNCDRMTTSLALLSQKKAPEMIVTGGGYKQKGHMFSEADAVVGYLKQTLGLTLNITSLGICADTHDEAVKVAALSKEKGWQRILLVTSATHMSRAVATFEKAGLKVSAVPCDYQSSFNSITDISWLHLPKTNSLQGFASWSHEIIGTWIYRLRGWI